MCTHEIALDAGKWSRENTSFTLVEVEVAFYPIQQKRHGAKIVAAMTVADAFSPIHCSFTDKI